MKKQRKRSFLIKPIICLLMLALTIVITASVTVNAAGKKKVRVSSQEELIAAINNSEIGTIMLVTETVDPITIASNKNAKSKKLVVSAPYATITNKAKFKSITLKSAALFKEAVSGNTIELPTYYLANLELAKKKSIKKLILTGMTGFEEIDMFSIIRKGAKVKSIVYKDYSGTFSMDTKTRTLSFETDLFEWGEPAKVVMKFDKAGRLIYRSEDYEYEEMNDTEYRYKYDKNGNILEARGYSDAEERMIEDVTKVYTYDAKNRVESLFDRGRYSALTTTSWYYYDLDGRLFREVGEGSTIDGDTGNYNDYLIEYSFDSNGRRKKMIKETAELSSTYEYEYNAAGCKTSEKMTDSDHPGDYCLDTITYDKYGNIKKTVSRYYGNQIITYEYTYSKYGEWIKTVSTDADGEQYTYTPDTAG